MPGPSPDRPGGLAQGVPEGCGISIGDNITVWVTKARGGWTGLVIGAPRELIIQRLGRWATDPTEGDTDGTQQSHQIQPPR